MSYPRDSRGRPGVYEYEFNADEVGDWQVQVRWKDKVSEEIVAVGECADEMDDPAAKPEILAEICQTTGGRLVAADKIAELAEILRGKYRLRREARMIAAWNLPVLLVAFIILVCLDCWVRKRRGMV